MNSFTVTAVGHLARNPETAVKGDTQSRVMKPAKLKGTGATVPVPIFVAIGDKITVNTQPREYSGRVLK